MKGHISEKALATYSQLLSELQGVNFSEGETYDFTRCVRPDGSSYGTGGKCRKGTEEEKAERYTPKKHTLGGSVKVTEENLRLSRFDIAEAERELKLLKKDLPRKLEKIDKEDLPDKVKEKRKRLLRDRVTAAEVALSQTKKNHEFLEKLKRNLSEGIELRYTGLSGIVMISRSKNNNVITATYTVESGFDFMVNGRSDIGQVKDRKEQVEVALKVKKCWDTLVQSLPTGSIVKTSAWDQDGKEKERQKAYMRVGFSEPLRGSDKMYSQKKEDGSMAPIRDKKAIESQRNNPDALFFSEGLSSKEKVKAWVQIVTGDSLQSK
jgi:hypothetical protein